MINVHEGDKMHNNLRTRRTTARSVFPIHMQNFEDFCLYRLSAYQTHM